MHAGQRSLTITEEEKEEEEEEEEAFERRNRTKYLHNYAYAIGSSKDAQLTARSVHYDL